MKKNRLWFFIACLTIVSCVSKTEKQFCKFFLYKPLDESPAYMVTLPFNSKIESILSAHSKCYTFFYHNAIFYISEEYPYKSQDTMYNFLLKTQHFYQLGERINTPGAGIVYESGRHDNIFWKYCLIYNLEKPNHIYGVSNSGFEHLYVGYVNASETDTAVLNDCISSVTRIEKNVKKRKTNKIIKCNLKLSPKFISSLHQKTDDEPNPSI